jgi:ADP-ribosylglycohydrolase
VTDDVENVLRIPGDYEERVYAGVLGKIIGVYLGRPFEGWEHQRIERELGEVLYYVNDRRDLDLKNHTLVVTDDDISGTFTFVRALPDYGNSLDLSPAQIGQSWLNYIVERRTILWWGGMGNSTEHTAYLRLKNGIQAPESGSIALNGKVVAEQIGSQIFIDGWAMVAPGDPELAADLARRAASVSHDGEAVYGAQVVAAMEAQAFVENDLDSLIDTAVGFVPKDSVIFGMIDDIRAWHAGEKDWRKTRGLIEANYGYDEFGGNCHMVPNHALIIHALLHGEDDFQRSLMIVNTCGWDTDCNSGNVGCLLGIKNGLPAIDGGPDWRGPVADRMYLPTADGGRAITDAATEAYHIVNVGRALSGQEPVAPKDGARFHFELPGSVQGFQPDDDPTSRGVATVENVKGHSEAGSRSLALRYRHLAPGRVARVSTPTFVPPEAVEMPDYRLLASPTLYPGQDVRARVIADDDNGEAVTCTPFVCAYGADDALRIHYGPGGVLEPGSAEEFEWRVGDLGGQPIARIGVELAAESAASGCVYLDYVTWDGAPDATLTRPAEGGTMWRRAWVNGVDRFDEHSPEPYRLVQNSGTGLLVQGTRGWTDYEVGAPVRPHMVASAGIGARVQGMRRYYALLLAGVGKVRLVKALDGDAVLAETDFPWRFDVTYDLRLEVRGSRLRASIDGEEVFDVQDTDRPLTDGAVALVCEEGRAESEFVRVRPLRGDLDQKVAGRRREE